MCLSDNGGKKEGDMRFFQYFFYKGRILFYALLSLLFAALLLFFRVFSGERGPASLRFLLPLFGLILLQLLSSRIADDFFDYEADRAGQDRGRSDSLPPRIERAELLLLYLFSALLYFLLLFHFFGAIPCFFAGLFSLSVFQELFPFLKPFTASLSAAAYLFLLSEHTAVFRLPASSFILFFLLFFLSFFYGIRKRKGRGGSGEP